MNHSLLTGRLHMPGRYFCRRHIRFREKTHAQSTKMTRLFWESADVNNYRAQTESAAETQHNGSAIISADTLSAAGDVTTRWPAHDGLLPRLSVLLKSGSSSAKPRHLPVLPSLDASRLVSYCLSAKWYLAAALVRAGLPAAPAEADLMLESRNDIRKAALACTLRGICALI